MIERIEKHAPIHLPGNVSLIGIHICTIYISSHNLTVNAGFWMQLIWLCFLPSPRLCLRDCLAPLLGLSHSTNLEAFRLLSNIFSAGTSLAWLRYFPLHRKPYMIWLHSCRNLIRHLTLKPSSFCSSSSRSYAWQAPFLGPMITHACLNFSDKFHNEAIIIIII